MDEATRAPIDDVVVSVSAPQFHGEDVAVTDAAGRWRFFGLPVGSYRVRFEKEGYRSGDRTDVLVAPREPVLIDVVLHKESLRIDPGDAKQVVIDLDEWPVESLDSPQNIVIRCPTCLAPYFIRN